jgi:hypothetical protein
MGSPADYRPKDGSGIYAIDSAEIHVPQYTGNFDANNNPRGWSNVHRELTVHIPRPATLEYYNMAPEVVTGPAGIEVTGILAFIRNLNTAEWEGPFDHGYDFGHCEFLPAPVPTLAVNHLSVKCGFINWSRDNSRRIIMRVFYEKTPF